MYVQCRHCETCMKARKRHWVGRILAEMQTCTETWFTTHTYAGGYDNGEAYWIEYADIQLMFKRLRKDGYKFKYVTVGEYGEKRNRGHFHCMLFWQSAPPPVEEMNARIQWPYWKKGYSQIEYPRSAQASAAYIMDYLNKDNLEKCVMKYSKNPMLGTEYLIEYARKHAREGLALFAQGDHFTVPGNVNREGNLFYYPVGRQTGMYTKMLHAYLDEWAIVRPEQRLKQSEDLTDFLIETTQNPEQFTPNAQEYMKRVYDIHTVEIAQADVVTYYALPNCTLINYPTYMYGEVYNKHGDKVWDGHVTNDLKGTHRTVLDSAQLKAAVEQLKQKAPQRARECLTQNL